MILLCLYKYVLESMKVCLKQLRPRPRQLQKMMMMRCLNLLNFFQNQCSFVKFLSFETLKILAPINSTWHIGDVLCAAFVRYKHLKQRQEQLDIQWCTSDTKSVRCAKPCPLTLNSKNRLGETRLSTTTRQLAS